HITTVNGAVAGDDAVAFWMTGVHTERGGPVGAQLVEFDKRIVVQQGVDAFARGLFTPGMLAIDGSLSSRQHCCFAPVEIVFKFASRRSDVRGGNTQVFTSAVGVGQRVLQARVWPGSWIILPDGISECSSASR